MKVEFAPLNIPLTRRLQTAAVLQWVLSFLLLASQSAGITGMSHCGQLYLSFMCYLKITKLDYFPIHVSTILIKTQDLDPSHNYIFGFHPHGVLVAGAFGNFCTNYSDFKELFPGFTAYLHVLPFWFRCPLFREYLMSSGPVSVSKKSVSYVLSKDGGGNISVIVLGGAEESLDAHPGKFTLFIRQRKGFVKIALTQGWRKRVKTMLTKILRIGRPIPVRQTLHPTLEQIEELHQTYMEELRKLFEEHKGKYGISEHETLI
uniref:2-acylglycerol O-acyltransferase 1 n=1 Tax=Aotus nancymaae TaxID=37293 RepID=A0A2K5DZS0_AOTNA